MMLSPDDLPPQWRKVLADEFGKSYFIKLNYFLQKEYADFIVYPPKNLIFNAFQMTDFDAVRVVLLGQDPYHGPNQANGLAFSVSKGIPLPRSLRNIFIELKNDLGIPLSPHGSLETWARQGVFLLNTILTVRAGQPASHANQGWEAFTDQCLSLLWAKKTPLIFVLWGKFAQEKALRILQPSNGHHTILMSSHPSPFSASKGFLGSHPFSKVNEELTKLKSNPIDWRLI